MAFGLLPPQPRLHHPLLPHARPPPCQPPPGQLIAGGIIGQGRQRLASPLAAPRDVLLWDTVQALGTLPPPALRPASSHRSAQPHSQAHWPAGTTIGMASQPARTASMGTAWGTHAHTHMDRHRDRHTGAVCPACTRHSTGTWSCHRVTAMTRHTLVAVRAAAHACPVTRMSAWPEQGPLHRAARHCMHVWERPWWDNLPSTHRRRVCVSPASSPHGSLETCRDPEQTVPVTGASGQRPAVPQGRPCPPPGPQGGSCGSGRCHRGLCQAQPPASPLPTHARLFPLPIFRMINSTAVS